MAIDFSSLLAKPTDEIKKPKPLPEGSYSGLTTQYKYETAKTPNDRENPEKPVVRMQVKLNEAMADVDAADLNDALQGEALSSKQALNYDFWLTPDAQYRVLECAQSMGIDTEGKTLGEVIPAMMNQPVTVTIIKVQSKKQGQEDVFYSNIGSLVGTAG